MNLLIRQKGSTALAILGVSIIPILIAILFFIVWLKNTDVDQLALHNAALSGIPLLLDTTNPHAAENACRTAVYSLAQTVSMTSPTCRVESEPAANPAFALILSGSVGGQTYTSRAAWMPCQQAAQCGEVRYAVILQP